MSSYEQVLKRSYGIGSIVTVQVPKKVIPHCLPVRMSIDAVKQT